ncbi:antiporter [Bacillus sp. SA1-12]|uniref:MFS transporter n=1 Tax=Bacillus sp. SA1-12 TaxID=1455638 RepID=UPI0006270A88|nr:MFS transporter [Bacillus sp. SA1-12]KKI90071.1 antiporter [Bacillus sp. SA1-12]
MMETKITANRQKLIYLLMITLIFSAMSGTIFNIVLPQISEEFELSISEVSWISSAYGLIYAIGAVTYGKLADLYKLKKLLTIGLLLFAGGSLLGLVSQTFWLILVARCLQAMGAAAIPATAMIIPIRYFPPKNRGYASGMAASGLAIGTAVGPIISALIISIAHWRWLFSITLLILLVLPFYRKYLGDEVGEGGSFDWIGCLSLCGTIVMLLLGVSNGSWFFLAGSLLFLILFIARIQKATDPFIQPKLFKNKQYTFSLVLFFLVNAIGYSLYFLSPILLSAVQNLSSNWIGFALVPAAVASAVLGRKGGSLADKKGTSYLFFIASGLLIICFLLLFTFTESSPIWIAGFLISGNVGQTFMMIAMTLFVSFILPKEQTGVGMGLLSMTNFISASIATGIYAKIVDIGANNHINPLVSDSSSFIYSNIYFVLFILHAGILLTYYFMIAKGYRNKVQLNTRIKA